MGPRTPIIWAGMAMFAATAGDVEAALDPDAATVYPGYAEVLRVEAITQRQQQRTPVQRCTWEQLPSRVRYQPSYGHGPAVRRVTERRAKRCRTVYRDNTVEQVTGYDVTLSYNGEIFTRRTLTHPGARLPVTVELTPVEQP